MPIMVHLDFSSTHSPSPGEFLAKIALMSAVWICALFIVKSTGRTIAGIFWSHDVPVDAASIPSKLPHPNQAGSAVPFDIPLLKATDDQIHHFMAFRGLRYQKGEEGALQHVANSAAQYKGQLYEERTLKWIDDHFRLKLKGLQYPYVDKHWNGWPSMWIETADHIREMFLSSIVVIVEHCTNGLLLPGLYLLTHDVRYYNLALYGEIAFMVYASALIAMSYMLEKDVTIEQMHRSVWPMLLVHHISSMALCVGCIVIEENIPKDLVCTVLLALVGLTSSLHYVGQILDFSPLAQSNRPLTRLCNHLFCLASQILFRCIYWMKILYDSISIALENHGAGIAAIVGLVLFLFTLFNVDFIKFHLKATKGCWMKMQEGKMGKEF
ncbi:hypothetical protein ACHAXT_011117 [Thalassiosira profunda]